MTKYVIFLLLSDFSYIVNDTAMLYILNSIFIYWLSNCLLHFLFKVIINLHVI